jgi:1-acyl-sn-glycerol-3-phosphate acyltransferase
MTPGLDLIPRAAGRGMRLLGATWTSAETMARKPFGASKDDPLNERDPEFIEKALPLYLEAANAYFRADVRGLDNVPSEGPVLLAGNHSGGFYVVDTFAFAAAFYDHFGTKRRFHQLAHQVAFNFAGLGTMLRKFGGIPASHENAARAFERDAAVLVYPGGEVESFRPTTASNEVDFAGRTGFIRLALEHNVPIVPVVAIGGQETALFVTRGRRLAKLLQLDRLARLKVLPIQIGPPFGLTVLDLPLRIPLPASLTIQVLPKIDLRERFGQRPDEEKVYEALTAEMQATLDELAKERDLPVVGRVWSEPRDTERPARKVRQRRQPSRNGGRSRSASRNGGRSRSGGRSGGGSSSRSGSHTGQRNR